MSLVSQVLKLNRFFYKLDDLDMSFRLHISGYNIVLYDGELIVDDPVHSWSQLWQQRIRWMTGGFQRFIDYTYFLAFSDFEIIKKLDVCHTFGGIFISLFYC